MLSNDTRLTVADRRLVGSRLLKARKACGFKQAEAAQHLGVSPAALSRIENGKTRRKTFDLGFLGRAAALYKVSTDALLAETGVRPEIVPSAHPSTPALPQLSPEFAALMNHPSVGPTKLANANLKMISTFLQGVMVDFALRVEAHTKAGGESLQSIMEEPLDG